MGKKYGHLKEQDRLTIYGLILEGESIAGIAERVNVHKSTIYRELNRNASKIGYRPDFAAQQYLMRRRGKLSKIEKDKLLAEIVIKRLKEGWSPEQIAGRLKREKHCTIVSHETIYLYIYSPSQRTMKLYQYLRKKRRFRYPKIRRGAKNTIK